MSGGIDIFVSPVLHKNKLRNDWVSKNLQLSWLFITAFQKNIQNVDLVKTHEKILVYVSRQ